MVRKLSILFVSLLMLITASAPVVAKNLYCAQCGKLIQGRYYEFKGKAYCIRDYEKVRLRCVKCGQPIEGSYYTKDGQIFCPRDFEQLVPRCAHCHKPLTAKYYSYKGKNYCARDFELVRPKCSKCHKPLQKEYYTKQGKHYCSACYQTTIPVCNCCHKKVTGKYCTYYDGTVACVNCANNTKLPTCVICTCPVNPQQIAPLPKYGTYLCQKHQGQGIISLSEVKTMLNTARQRLIQVFGPSMRIRGNVELRLCGLEDLKRISPANNKHVRGMTSTKQIGKSCKHTVYFLAGMDREEMYSSIYHELAHAWQSENHERISSTDTVFKEGFCQWISYCVTAAFSDKKQLQRILDNKSDAYYEGLRLFLDYEKQHGRLETYNLGKTGDAL